MKYVIIILFLLPFISNLIIAVSPKIRLEVIKNSVHTWNNRLLIPSNYRNQAIGYAVFYLIVLLGIIFL